MRQEFYMVSEKENRKVEILAPAGTYESFQAALKAGADAVYAGGALFGARAYAGNFSEEELLRAIDEAHLQGRKLYLTVNTLLKEKELEKELFAYLAPYYEQGLDAVIVQDFGVLSFIREQFPLLPVHASTQMTVTGAKGACFLKRYGVERVVPARELTLPEIRRMKEESGLEIECFVHGALCYSYSGQCLFSSMLGGRSGNRGQCAQPCRLKYQMEGQKKPSCLLSLKDIMTLDVIPELIEAGIDSFKIEGRMKKPEYVAAVTGMYRKYADLYLEKGEKGFRVQEEDRLCLMDLYNRGGSCGGYYHMQNGKEMVSLDRPNHAGTTAACAERQKGRSVLMKALADLGKGDVLEISESESITLGQDVKKGGQFSVLAAKGTQVKPRAVIARTRNERLIAKIREQLARTEQSREIQMKMSLKAGEPMRLEISDGMFRTAVSGAEAEEALRQPVDEVRIEKQLKKTGNTGFKVSGVQVCMEGKVFVPMQAVNELRRKAVGAFREEILKAYKRKRPADIKESRGSQGEKQGFCETDKYRLSVSVETKKQLLAAFADEDVSRIYVDGHLNAGEDGIFAGGDGKWFFGRAEEWKKSGRQKELYLSMPHIFRERAEKLYDSLKEEVFAFPWDGVLVRNLESLAYIKENARDIPVIADSHLYTFNRRAEEFLLCAGADEATVPLELNDREIRDFASGEEELTVYGYCPMMISAGCIKKTVSGCDGKPETKKIKDRYQKTFYVKNYCDTCYNIIYNTAPLVLLDKQGEIRETGIRKLRLSFTTESGEETGRIIRLYADAFIRGEEPGKPEEEFLEFTRGHFKRGIK